MQYPAVVTLSGPEKTRAKAELALEKARLTVIPPTEWPICRQSYQAEHWPHLTVLPSGQEPDEEHGFVAVLAETEAAFHQAYGCVEKHKWVLRVHHELPEQPKPREDIFGMLLQRMDAQEQRIAELTRKLGGHPSIGGAAFESGAGEFMQAGSYSAAQMRRSMFSWAARTGANLEGTIAGGLLSATDMQLTAAVSGLVVNTSVGACLIGGSEASNQGGYHAFLSSQSSTTLATANASNARIDLMCATAGDASYTIPSGGTSGAVTLQVVTGTPTTGATLINLSGAPALPLSSLLLGYVQVPATATNITNTNIANKATASGIPVQTFNGRSGAVTGVDSFNSRSGAVTPASGDYTPAMVGIARGTTTITWPGGTGQSNEITVTHGLPSASVVVPSLAVSYGFDQDFVVYSAGGTSTTFNVWAYTAGSSPSSSFTLPCQWVAVA